MKPLSSKASRNPSRIVPSGNSSWKSTIASTVAMSPRFLRVPTASFFASSPESSSARTSMPTIFRRPSLAGPLPNDRAPNDRVVGQFEIRVSTLSGPVESAQSAGRVSRLSRNVRQSDHVLGNSIAGHQVEGRSGAGEEWPATTEHDGVEVDSILVNKTKVGQASCQGWSGNFNLPV